MEIHVVVPVLFMFLFLTVIFLYPFLGKVSPQIFELKYILIFFAMLITGITWNFFYYKGVQSEKVQDFELILMLQPLFTIVLASLFLKGESNIRIEIAAIVAAIALILSQVKKHHFSCSEGAVEMLVAVIFMSIELIFIRVLLDVMSPVALYAIRTGIFFVFFFIYYHPQINRVSNTNAALILGTAALATTQMVVKFYGFTQYGVVYTSLILILAPFLVYIFSSTFLHERLKPKTVICGVVILGCILYATLLGK